MGGPGVTRALEIIQKELDLTMAFCGQTDLKAIDRRILFPQTDRYQPAPVALAAA
jgi:L-lactate dehydrogenase (cytochrome)